MKCPIDGADLVVSSRDGVEIDFCPQCRGVWLDRGELDKIIDRVATGLAGAAQTPPAQTYVQPTPSPPPPPQGYPQPAHDDRYREPRRDDRDYRDDRGYRDDRDYRSGDKRRRRRNFLDDLFDFD